MGISSTGYQRPRGGVVGSNSTNSTSFQTALDIQGAGKLVQVLMNCGDPITNSTGYLKVTIDGTVALNISAGANYHNPVYIGNSNNSNNLWYSTSPFFLNLSFNKSLKIEYYASSSSYSQYIYYVYDLE